MVNVLTFKGIWELLKKKINGEYISEENIKDVENYIENKKKLTEKPRGQFYSETQYKGDMKQLKLALLYLQFLKKDDITTLKMPKKVHPGGVSRLGFVIEPIGNGMYVYNWVGRKGITASYILEGGKRVYLNIEGHEIEIDGKPIKNFAFKTPDMELVNKWVNDEVESDSIEHIWDELMKYFHIFGDLSEECFYEILGLFVIQSWLIDYLDTVFYTAVSGAFGAGKTVLAQMCIELCKHGVIGSPSAAIIARTIHAQKATLFIDELDSIVGTEDSERLSILRQGYRRGLPYARCGKETLEPEYYDVFGPKLFTLHADLDDGGIMSRVLPVLTRESNGSQLPIINSIRNKISPFIFDKLFLWYMDNIILVDVVDVVDYIYNTPLYNREGLFGRASLLVEEGQLNELSQLKPRNAELGFVVAKICKLICQPNDFLGKNDVNQINKFKGVITKIFETKQEIDEATKDTSLIGTLRDYLVLLWKKKRDMSEFITQEGFVKIAHKEVISRFQEHCKNRGLYPHASQIRGSLKELGFENKINLKPMKIRLPDEDEPGTRLALIYDFRALRQLGLKCEKIEVDLQKYQEEKVE